MKINSKNTRTMILELCTLDRKFASNDKLLIAEIWKREGWRKDDTIYENLKKCTSPETIRRTRAKLQSEGLIKPDDRVLNLRYEEMKRVRNEDLW